MSLDGVIIMVHNDGMAIMMHRTTFSLDELTIKRVKKLSLRWRVSQAEAVRRALEQVDQKIEQGDQARIDCLLGFHKKGGLNRAKAEKYLEEVAENRADWGRSR